MTASRKHLGFLIEQVILTRSSILKHILMSANRDNRAPKKEYSVFISYRRKDTPGYVARLCDDIVSRFGEVVFRDVDSILGGDHWKIALKRQVAQARVVLAIIGDHWLTELQSKKGPTDYVRLELNSAKELGIDVVPILLDDVRLPERETLGDLAWLLNLQVHSLSDLQNRWKFDSEQLLDIIKSKAQLEEVAVGNEQNQPWWYDRKWWIGAVGIPVITAIIVGILSLGGGTNVQVNNGVGAAGDIRTEGDITVQNSSEQKK